MFEGPGAAYHPDTVPGGGGPVGTPGKDHAELNVLVGTGPRLFGCRLILLKYPPPLSLSAPSSYLLLVFLHSVEQVQLAYAS
jgi:hypothetical protein